MYDEGTQNQTPTPIVHINRGERPRKWINDLTPRNACSPFEFVSHAHTPSMSKIMKRQPRWRSGCIKGWNETEQDKPRPCRRTPFQVKRQNKNKYLQKMRTSYRMSVTRWSGQLHHIHDRVMRSAPNKCLYHLKPSDYIYTNAVIRYTSIKISRHIVPHTWMDSFIA